MALTKKRKEEMRQEEWAKLKKDLGRTPTVFEIQMEYNKLYEK